jgi:hypothetical protein
MSNSFYIQFCFMATLGVLFATISIVPISAIEVRSELLGKQLEFLTPNAPPLSRTMEA